MESGNLSWTLSSIPANSSQSVFFSATLKDNVVQGSSIPIKLSIDYSDTAGFVISKETNTESVIAELRSRFSLDLISQTDTVNSGEILELKVYFNNSGHGSADSIKFNLSIPMGLIFVTSSENCLISSDVCYWELFDVGPGSNSFTITLRTEKLDTQVFRTADMTVTMQVTDPVDGTRPAVESNGIFIDINRIYTFQEKIYWPWSGLVLAIGISAITLGLWYRFKPIPPSIDDAFVIYRDGRLISHRKSGKGKDSELDGDLVSAMLTAVQEFISDSLSKDKADKVKKLEFGDRELFLERGNKINLVLIYSGSLSKKLEQQARELVDKIESEHAFLEKWDGRMSQLSDINVQLDGLIKNWQTAKAA